MNKLEELRIFFNIFKIDGYIIPKNDEFFGEYVAQNNDRLKFISSFTGSAGQALILKNSAYLFVDGRYTIQAQQEAHKDFKVVEIHKKKPSNILNKIKRRLKIGFDPKLYSKSNLNNNYNLDKINLIPLAHNLIDIIWQKNNATKINKFYILNDLQTGENYKHKIKKVCKILKNNKIDNLLITAPENIAWLLNIRGKDSDFSPIPNCHALLSKNGKVVLIINKKKISIKFKSYFKNNINYISPDELNIFLKKINKKDVFLIDKSTCSFYYRKIISKKFKFVENLDPIFHLKAKKNKTEISSSIKSHVEDGLALTRFLHWIKDNINKTKITEITAEKKLESFRKKNKNYKFPSFNTISGTGPNGAIVHYRAKKDSCRKINKNDIYLCDSGGQYHYGTTDVTRTICFSKQPNSIKNIFTKVLKGHIAVATANLNKFNTGKHLDRQARKYLKKDKLDYSHGTGHGVGFFLNVHEGPQSISKFNNVKLVEGMILSNEPGYYKKNHYGIRIENLVYVKKIDHSIFFENLTLAPIEKDLINYNLLNKKEKNYLFKYHLKVYSNHYKFLNKKERKWLASFI